MWTSGNRGRDMDHSQRWLSRSAGEVSRGQDDARGREQGLNDEAGPAAAQSKVLALQQQGVAVLATGDMALARRGFP